MDVEGTGGRRSSALTRPLRRGARHHYNALLGWVLLWLVAVPAWGQEREAYRLPLVAGPPHALAAEAPPRVAALQRTSTTIVYDAGQPALVVSDGEARLEVYTLSEGSRQANRFAKAPGDSLLAVAVAPYYASDFTGTGVPPSAPRDFWLVFWDDNGQGAPGDSVAALYVEDDRINLGSAFEFLDVRLDTLAALQAQLLPLATVYVGLINAGDDANRLAMGVAEYDPDVAEDRRDASYLWLPEFFDGQGGWRRFDQIYSQITGDSLYNRVLPIRATVFTEEQGTRTAIGGTVRGGRQVGVDGSGTLPTRPALLGNHPNPFNPTTTITYALPETGPVRLAVYDLLGRVVEVLIDGVQPAGRHAHRVEAAKWHSGVYLVTLEAAGHRQTRRMILIK